MKKSFLLSLLIFFGCKDTPEIIIQKPTFGIVIHGGAGTILRKNMTPEKETNYRAVLTKAIQVGYEILKAGGSSQKAVEKTIHIMEDSPLFNAGKGAVLNSNASIELDASFMNGKSLDAGAISALDKNGPRLFHATCPGKCLHVRNNKCDFKWLTNKSQKLLWPLRGRQIVKK